MKLKGIGASEGLAVAKIFYVEAPDLSVSLLEGQDPKEQQARFEAAKSQAQAELDILYEKACKTDMTVAQVFEVDKMMLDDPDFCESVEEMLAGGMNAEYAVYKTAETLKAMFAAMDSEYMQARAVDVGDVSDRVIRILKGIRDLDDKLEENVIVAAEDLLPSQTVRLDKEKVVGFVTKSGSATSHSAILARTMGIPCIVGLGEGFGSIPRNGILAIDGRAGEVLISPTEAELSDHAARREAWLAEKAALEQYRGREAVASSGKRVLVCANIGSMDDINAVIENDADGVGLFRSEFIYLNSRDFPTEEAQLGIYRVVLEKLAPRPVVVRTLDLGSDKQAPYFGIENEENPAMGYRAIRICLRERHIFRTQLRALLRASVYGNLSIMFPMITHVEQVREIKEILSGVKAELDSEGIAYSGGIQYGIMVETPAAVMMSDVLAKEVDFFSIGTNDLTQYTMAADRMNAKVSELFDSSNPAILRMIEMTAKNAHDEGIWVGICGESAANTSLTDFYMRVGIDELSVSPSSVLSVKKAVIESK